MASAIFDSTTNQANVEIEFLTEITLDSGINPSESVKPIWNKVGTVGDQRDGRNERATNRMEKIENYDRMSTGEVSNHDS